MRVAYVCADRGVPIFGRKGASVHVQEVLRALGRRARVEVFARRIDGDPPEDLATVPVHRLPAPARGEVVVRERADLDSNADLRAALGAAGPFDLLYERHSIWSFAGMEYAREHGIPGLLEVNAPLLVESRRYRRATVLADEAERAVGRAFAAATALLAVSGGVARHLEDHPDARGRVHVVPNGVDPARLGAAAAPARRDGVFRIGFVGTLKPWHGVDGLIEAAAALAREEAGVELLIVGDGPERDALERQAETLGLGPATVFTGSVDPARIPALLASMDVAVAPYPPLEDFYFSPMKMFEYMAAARPVVAAAIGQIADVITDGETGLLYPPGDVGRLAAALRRLRAEPALAAALGRAARDAAARDHTWDSVAARILSIAEASAERAPARPVG